MYFVVCKLHSPLLPRAYSLMNEFFIDQSRLELAHSIGQGAFGVVTKGRLRGRDGVWQDVSGLCNTYKTLGTHIIAGTKGTRNCTHTGGG